MLKSKILVLITGSIAAYKACYLVSKLVQNGFEVKIAASPSALEFVGRASLEGLSGNVVASDTFEHGHAMDHIHLVRWADLIITIPATANFINKIANGIGDDLLTTMALAHDFQKPFLICPAMNTQMYLHPATQKSILSLKEFGFAILETASGVLACGETGLGKLLDPELIYDEIITAIGAPKSNGEKPTPKPLPKVLVVSGGTLERIDDVRSITNTSSGKTGAMIASTLYGLGFDVSFLSAKAGAKPEIECDTHEFKDFKSLEIQLEKLLEIHEFAAIIMCAAVSDFSPVAIFADGKKIEGSKLSSKAETLEIKLQRNPKLINKIKTLSNGLLFGFKLTSGLDETQVFEKIAAQFSDAKCDYIIHNDLSETDKDKTKHLYHLYENAKNTVHDIIGTRALALEIGRLIMEKTNVPNS